MRRVGSYHAVRPRGKQFLGAFAQSHFALRQGRPRTGLPLNYRSLLVNVPDRLLAAEQRLAGAPGLG